MERYMTVISRNWNNSEIHYRVTDTGLTLSMDLEQFVRSLARAATVPQVAAGMFHKATKPAIDPLALESMLVEAMYRVREDMKGATIHNPPPLVEQEA